MQRQRKDMKQRGLYVRVIMCLFTCLRVWLRCIPTSVFMICMYLSIFVGTSERVYTCCSTLDSAS